MKNCGETRADLVAFVDGELDHAASAAVESHLSECPECQSERAALEDAWAALDHLPGIAPRPGWLAEVDRSIRDADRVIRFPARTVALFVALAASVAAAAGLAFLATQPKPNASPEVIAEGPAPRTDDDAPPPVVVPIPDAPTAPQPQTPETPETPEPDQDEPQLAAVDTDDDFADLTDEELAMLEDFDVLQHLDDLEDADVLDSLDLLDDLEDEELAVDET